MTFLIEPHHDIVVAEGKKLGIEILWSPGEDDWIVRVPGAPIRAWYRTPSGTDAINTAKVMALFLARREEWSEGKLSRAKATAGLAPRITKERFIHLIQHLDKGKKIFLCVNGMYIQQHKSNLLDAVLISIPDGHTSPLWLDTYHDEYNYVLRIHPNDREPNV